MTPDNTPTSDAKALLELVEQALDMPTADRDDWLMIHCPEPLKAKAQRMISAADGPTSESDDAVTLIVKAAEQQLSGQRIGAYDIVELLGEGGMGQVYLAERADGSFDQQVAIKVIRASAVGSRAVAQFLSERQILSDLAHPNIAALLDGGQTDDGMPYVVMEFIDGLPLDVFIRERQLELNARLELFLQICSAVEHAHRALVIHRDIKPSNILVDNNGTPKLLDFGIARSLAPRQDDQDTVAMLLTPAYASPEQVTGEPLTTATDIYSLGVVLYQCLTGERPYETDSLSPAQYERVITQVSPDAPSARAHERNADNWQALRGELDAVVLKAMAKEPERRYESVSAFAQDIRRYLGGFPVSAQGDSVGYRVRKFVSRRRLPVAASVLAVVALIAAYGVTVYQYQVATAERERADARFDQARELARQVFFDVYDKMSYVQGTLPAREALAATGVTYLDELAQDEFAPDDILLDLGVQYTRLYDLYAGLGVASLGKSEEAIVLLQKADDALSKLLDRSPVDAAAAAEMVWVKRLATNHYRSYDMNTEEAERQAREGLAIADRVVANLAERDWYLESRRWNLRIDLVNTLNWDSRTDEALELLDVYLVDLDDADFADNVVNHAGKKAYALGLRGEINADAGRTELAIPDYEQAVAFYEARLQEQPDNYQMLVQAMRFNFNLANMKLRTNDFSQALINARRGETIARQMVAIDPRDAGARRNLAAQQQVVAKSLVGDGQHELANTVITSAIDSFRTLADEDTDNASLQRDHASALVDAGDIFSETVSKDVGCGYYRHSQTIWKSLDRADQLTAYDRTTGLERLEQILADEC
ncbi:MAG: serine/threonine protein kinase [Pseudomonadaceae bacterium]|nr:serine/threonine protein kinase [Pseudomonadaceae bacterium]